jgi:hypothetical protein
LHLTLPNSRRYLRFSIDGRFTINFNQVAAYAATPTAALRGFPRKRSVIITQSPLNSQAYERTFPDTSATVSNPLASRVVHQQCNQLGDCLEALHARTSRIVQSPASGHPNAYFKGGGGTNNRAYDNEVLLEPIFTALPSMDTLLSITVPFSQPLLITSALGLGVQNKWIPDES